MKLLMFFVYIFFHVNVFNCTTTVYPAVETTNSKDISKRENANDYKTNIYENNLNESVPQVNYVQQCSINIPDKTTPMSKEKDIYDKIVESNALAEQQLKKLNSIENILSVLIQNTSHVVYQPEEDVPKDCFEFYYMKGIRSSGVYKIKPLLKVFDVYCDMETDGGGWTVIQNRFNGSVNFYKKWDEYKIGFGNIGTNSEFWLGLENIHQLTYNQISKLRIDLQDFNEISSYEIYSNFAVDTEVEGYSLKSIGVSSGPAGNSLDHHVGYKFSTFDNDNDNNPGNCANIYTGAWWYNSCHNSNLNGQYIKGQTDKNLENKGIVWRTFRGNDSLKKSKMMVRRSI